jgi:RNA polymerase sigma factor (sigma-70 family)
MVEAAPSPQAHNENTVARSRVPNDGSADARSKSVAEGFGRGDPQAAREVRERVRKIVGYRAYGMGREDRRDVEQEVMIQLWQLASRRDGGEASGFWGLVEVVAARRCIDWLRRRREHLELSPAFAGGADPLADALGRERRSLGEEALRRLGPACRELVRLHLGDGLDYRELAQLLGRTEGALRVQMHRCVRRAAEILAELRQAPGAATENVGQ